MDPVSLVVAQMHESGLTLIGDTKISDLRPGSETENRQVFRHAHPKIVVLRDDLAVGVAGDDPQRSVPRVHGMRTWPIDDILSELVGLDHASFVVATLGPSRLWQITRGQLEDRTALSRAWIGDPMANEIFREQFGLLSSSSSREVDFCMWGAMQELISGDYVQSVGGYTTRVRTTRDGFRFAPDEFSAGPDLVHGVITRGVSISRLEIQAAPDVASQGYEVMLAVGENPTIGALACFIPQARTAWLFPDHAPWEVARIRPTSMKELIEVASQSFGQKLRSNSGGAKR